jgi:ech hydrogenase subunit A
MVHFLIGFFDFVLLLYFMKVGFDFKNIKIQILALIQLILFAFAELNFTHSGSPDFIIDELAIFMMIIINIVGGAIALYGIKYMKYEDAPKYKKDIFLVYLWIFLVIMNFAVISNNLLYFFFFFELTTLSSFLLIKFRNDDISNKNAINALLLNMIGGLFLLIAVCLNLFTNHSIYINEIIQNKDYISAAMIFVVFAAFIKGAMKPFESWLLGAMVAPTPVSALLHSATMVKIAPFLVLKFSPVFSYEISFLITLLGMFLFFIFALEGLGKNSFKEILAYSTISLLSLMIAVAAIGTKESYEIALLLIFFHAISKAILFMCAGILEKLHHIKSIDDMQGLMSADKPLALLILVSFATVALPPFGLFFAKLFFVEYLAKLIQTDILYIFIILFFVVGSSILVLLYFKIASLLLSTNNHQQTPAKTPLSFVASSYFLFVFMILSIIYLVTTKSDISIFSIIFGALFVSLIVSLFVFKFNNLQKISVYACGENTIGQIGQFYFDFEKYAKYFLYVAIFLWLVLFGVSL